MYVHAAVRYLINPLLDFRNPSDVANNNERNFGTHMRSQWQSTSTINPR